MASIEIDDDLADSIVIEHLKSGMEILEIDLNGRLNNSLGLGVFHNDRLKDIIEIEKHIDAFKLVLNWYEPDWLKNGVSDD